MSGELARGTARAEVPVRFLDLSMGGALLILPAPLTVGAIHDFALELQGALVWVQAEIRHVRAAERGPGFHIGVQFVGIDPQDEKILREFVDARDAKN